MELATVCKLEILPQYLFRNSNPAIFGVRVLGGKLKTKIPLIDENDESIARVKAIQHEKDSIEEASEGQEVALSLPGVNFERKLKDSEYLYSDMGPKAFKKFKDNKDLLSREELKILQELADIKRRKDEMWGM